MAIATVEMKATWHEARQAFVEYRDALRRKHSQDDEALMRAYGALVKGKRVIDLVATLRTAGEDAQGRPRLAIARADGERVECVVYDSGGGRMVTDSGRARSQFIRFPDGVFAARVRTAFCHARVPIIPPRFRPGNPSRYHLLWEAEWLTAPRDPILLRHLGRSFYAVIAQWDLTPLEQAVLAAKGPA